MARNDLEKRCYMHIKFVHETFNFYEHFSAVQKKEIRTIILYTEKFIMHWSFYEQTK